MDSILTLENVAKSFESPSSKERLKILSDINLRVGRGEVVAILGKSGSGKSTLLSISALLLRKDSGKILYEGKDSDEMSQREIERLRSTTIGFVFQSSFLMEDFSALENVMMPLLINRVKKADAKERAYEMLSLVGLEDRALHRPSKLSGGERERVAIARSLSYSPKIVFADEPTGSLDEVSAKQTEDLLLNAVKKNGTSLVLVTHNRDFASRSNRVLTLQGGRLEEL